ncbi:MAG: glycosyltransferase family 2 protein [Patescibacteria group bacterium]
MRVVAVVPAYNCADTISEVVSGLLRQVQEVVVVDDCSSDTTASRAEAAGATVLRHRLNRGQGAALVTGTRYALTHGADVIVHTDADGQHDAGEVPRLLAALADNTVDVALGSRFLGEAIALPMPRRIVLRLGIVFTWLFSGLWLTDTNNGFRAMTRKAADEIQIRQDRMAHASEIVDEIARLNLSYVEVPVTIRYSAASLAQGQRSSNAIKIALRLFVDTFYPHK